MAKMTGLIISRIADLGERLDGPGVILLLCRAVLVRIHGGNEVSKTGATACGSTAGSSWRRRRAIQSSAAIISSGQRAVLANPIRRDERSATTPAAHGMKMPPKLPQPASRPNMEAPPCGKWSAASARVLGNRHEPLTPATTEAVRATWRDGAKHASRNRI